MKKTLQGLTAALLMGGTAQAQATRNLAAEEANRRIVVEFYQDFFGKHDLSAAERFIGPVYVQHNPRVPNGREPFVGVFRHLFAVNPKMQASIVRSATSDDLVFLHVHAQTSPDDRGQMIVDIFRVKDDKIVEHWDVMQPIPAESANGNGMQ